MFVILEGVQCREETMSRFYRWVSISPRLHAASYVWMTCLHHQNGSLKHLVKYQERSCIHFKPEYHQTIWLSTWLVCDLQLTLPIKKYVFLILPLTDFFTLSLSLLRNDFYFPLEEQSKVTSSPATETLLTTDWLIFGFSANASLQFLIKPFLTC